MEGVTEWVEREVSTPSLPPAPGGDGGDGGDLGVGTSHPYGEGNPERACHVCLRVCCVVRVAVCAD